MISGEVAARALTKKLSDTSTSFFLLEFTDAAGKVVAAARAGVSGERQPPNI